VECEPKTNDPTPPPPEPAPQPQALSLKERMALLQGGSSDGASISAKAAGSAPSVKDPSPVAPSAPSHVGSSNSPALAAPAGGLHDRLKVFEGADTQNKQNLPSPAADMGGVQGKAGGLQDRLKLFAGAETQSKPEPTKQASAKSPTLQHCQPAKQASQEMRPQSLSLSISERMSALQGGVGPGPSPQPLRLILSLILLLYICPHTEYGSLSLSVSLSLSHTQIHTHYLQVRRLQIASERPRHLRT
jgi:hypothetical protein